MERRTCLVAGLGNPGIDYAGTRHNAGFMVLDSLACHIGVESFKNQDGAIYTSCRTAGRNVILLKPNRYMNRSGIPLFKAADRAKVKSDSILVVYDDVDIPLGRIRFRTRGCSGGHRGVESVIDALGSEIFNRLRIGVGRPLNGNIDTAEHVLKAFDSDEQKLFEKVLDVSVKGIIVWLRQGITAAANQFNGQIIGEETV